MAACATDTRARPLARVNETGAEYVQHQRHAGGIPIKTGRGARPYDSRPTLGGDAGLGGKTV